MWIDLGRGCSALHAPEPITPKGPALMRCVEFEAAAAGAAKGWQATSHTIHGTEPLFVACYCPACALREFGPRFASRIARPYY